MPPPLGFRPRARSKKVAVKLSPEELEFLNMAASFFGWKWSDVIRNSLALFKTFMWRIAVVDINGPPWEKDNPKRLLAAIQEYMEARRR